MTKAGETCTVASPLRVLLFPSEMRGRRGVWADAEQVIDSVKLLLFIGSVQEQAEGSLTGIATRHEAEAHNEVLIKNIK